MNMQYKAKPNQKRRNKEF
jgi:hypothetical protein